MAENSSIEWTDHTVNFWWGCMKVSPGCEHCYAETFSKRVGRNIWGPSKTTERWRTKGPWRDILKWDRKAKEAGIRQRVFCQSMSDFFEDHPQVDPWRREAIEILGSLEALDVQLLTKRPENVADMVPASWMEQWPTHIWIGTSVENQETADKRIPELLKVPAAVRFLSCEPLLDQVLLDDGCNSWLTCYGKQIEGECCESRAVSGECFHGIDWIIAGGESGHSARPFNIMWAAHLMGQCADAGVPFFMKQMGDHLIDRHGERIRLGKKGGDWNEWPEELRVREFPTETTVPA
jgi:protein gp37